MNILRKIASAVRDVTTIAKFVSAVVAVVPSVILLIGAELKLVQATSLYLLIAICLGIFLSIGLGWWIRRVLLRQISLSDHGLFELISKDISYEIDGPEHRDYKLTYKDKIKALLDFAMVYPIRYQWTGRGEEDTPKLLNKKQRLLSVFDAQTGKPQPYIVERDGNYGQWYYYFVAFDPPLRRDKTAQVIYTQEFHDSEGKEEKRLTFLVEVPVKRLRLRVKFPHGYAPKLEYRRSEVGSRKEAVKLRGNFDATSRWAEIRIEKPLRKHIYGIYWE